MATPKLATIVPSPKDVEVKIGLDTLGNITVSPETFWVSKKNEAKVHVMWVCTVEHEHGAKGIPCFTVDFNKPEKMLDHSKHRYGTPFSNWHFCGHGANSGPVKADIEPDVTKIFKYTVSMDGKSVDPGGGVKA
jgi:hypothetical protein